MRTARTAWLSLSGGVLVCLALVSLPVWAFWIAGSLISGATLATYVLVSDTWFAVHTARTETGARTHPAAISSAATG